MINRTVSIKGVDKPAHRMFFGTAIPVMLEGGDANALISTAVDAGFNAIDTARGYARAEESIAKWLKAAPGNRDRIVLLTKCCDMFGDRTQKVVTAERIRKEIDESLKILGTDPSGGTCGHVPRGHRRHARRGPGQPARRDARV